MYGTVSSHLIAMASCKEANATAGHAWVRWTLFDLHGSPTTDRVRSPASPQSPVQQVSPSSQGSNPTVNHSTWQPPLASIKPAHRPLHTQVAALLSERDELLAELERHRAYKEELVAERTADLRHNLDVAAKQLDAATASRRRLQEEVSLLKQKLLQSERQLGLQTSTANELNIRVQELGLQLKASEDSQNQAAAEATKLKRATIEERRQARQSVTDATALRQEVVLAQEQLQNSKARLAEEQSSNDALRKQLHGACEEGSALKDELAVMTADKERQCTRISSELTAERVLSLDLKNKLEAAYSYTETLTKEHALTVAAEQAAAQRLADMERVFQAKELEHNAAYVIAHEERASWAKKAMDETSSAKAAAMQMESLSHFLSKGTAILMDGARTVEEMNNTHEAAKCHLVVGTIWREVAKAGLPLATPPETNPTSSVGSLLQPLLEAATSYTCASAKLAHAAACEC